MGVGPAAERRTDAALRGRRRAWQQADRLGALLAARHRAQGVWREVRHPLRGDARRQGVPLSGVRGQDQATRDGGSREKSRRGQGGGEAAGAAPIAQGDRMAARTLALLVAVLGLSTVIACDRGSLTAPTSTSSNGVPTITASNVAAVGISVQEISSQTFLLLGGSLAQLGSLSAVQDSGPTLGTVTTVRTLDWSMACPDGGTRGISG